MQSHSPKAAGGVFLGAVPNQRSVCAIRCQNFVRTFNWKVMQEEGESRTRAPAKRAQLHPTPRWETADTAMKRFDGRFKSKPVGK